MWLLDLKNIPFESTVITTKSLQNLETGSYKFARTATPTKTFPRYQMSHREHILISLKKETLIGGWTEKTHVGLFRLGLVRGLERKYLN